MMPNLVMIDTCTFSDLSKPDTHRAKLYAKHVEGKTVAISFVTLGELYRGYHNLGPKRIADLDQRLLVVLKLPFSELVCRAYAEICELKTETGSARTLEDNDRWIAACAKAYGIPLVSHNRKHFRDIPGVTLIYEEDLPLFQQHDSTLPPPPSSQSQTASEEKEPPPAPLRP
jgi:predicted nucleic acid-binding protein